MQGGDVPSFAAVMPIHVPPQGFHYYRKDYEDDDSGDVGPLHFRFPHGTLAACAPLSPTYGKDVQGGDGFGRENCILELRKEKSRDAARSRRGKENYEFYELAKMLPLPNAITTQLDKASIIRLTISYLKLREFCLHGDPPWGPHGTNNNANNHKHGHKGQGAHIIRSRTVAGMAVEIFEQHQGTHILQSLDGFAFAVGADGRFLYISETVSIYLGLSQVELTGSSMFDYVHQQDHLELAEQLGINLSQAQSMPSPTSVMSDDGPSSPAASLMTFNNSSFKGLDRSFCIRMKSTLTKRGCHFKSSGYRVVLVLCHMRPQYTFSHSRKQPPTLLGMVALAIALPPPSVNEVRLENDMFVTRLNFDFKIAHCEPRVSELLDYTADELTGKNMYSLCHGEDMGKMRGCHVDLINKGQVMSGYYRIINKNGGYTWLQTCATVVCNTKNSEEQSIICVNYVISGIEHEQCIMDCSQMGGHIQNLKPDDPSNDYPESGSPDTDCKDGLDVREADSANDSPRNGDDKRSESNEHLTQLSEQKHNPVGGMTASANTGTDSMELSSKKQACRERRKSMADSDGEDIPPLQSVGGGSSGAGGNGGGSRRKRRRYRADNDHRPEQSAGGEHLSAPADRVLSQDVNSTRAHGPRAKRTLSPAATPCSPAKLDAVGGGGGQRGETPPIDSRAWSKFGGGGGGGQPGGSNGGGPEDYGGDDVGNASVKDLEDAMNKHLPLLGGKSEQGELQHGGGGKRATIQWIGGQPQQLQQQQQQQQPSSGVASPLPASTLLRQLYANRESVIRSNVHASRPAFFPGDVGPAEFGAEQFALPSPSGPSGKLQVGSHSAADAAAYAAAVLYSNHAGGQPPPSQVGYPDPYSAMTPPSSVSPRDKLHQPGGFGDGGASVYGDLRVSHFEGGGAGGPTHGLPLKPQVYTVHPLDSGNPFPAHAQQSHQTPDHAAQQFYAHQLHGGGGGFHIYHPTANKVHPGAGSSQAYVGDSLKNGAASWYPTSNT